MDVLQPIYHYVDEVQIRHSHKFLDMNAEQESREGVSEHKQSIRVKI